MNKFLENIMIMAIIAFITLILVHKPIDIGYKYYIEHGLLNGFYASIITLFLQLFLYVIIFGIGYGIASIYEWINKKKDE